MPQNYRLLRTTGSLDDLEQLVEQAMNDGWLISGNVFRDPDGNQWCLAMSREKPTEEVKIREPKKK
jgi:hypothetical protein